ncbi:MAG: YkgJ family cysteine cluster protein [Elusimicrobia bacterium]|nr:YkgJ family cysteine cluster protein [Elusimicrobiota bacterium]
MTAITEIFRKKQNEFSCGRCGKCCAMEGYVFLNRDDVEAIAAYMGMEKTSFLKKHTLRYGDRIRFRGEYARGCPMLESSGCAIYPARPRQCRTFPFWYENFRYESSLEHCMEYCGSLRRIIRPQR